MRNTNKQTNRKQMRNNNRRKLSSVVIPQLRTNVVKKHRFRFVASAALANVAITPVMIIGAAGGVCTVANSVLTPFNRSIRIKRLEIWSPTSTSTTSATCSVDWVGSGNSPNLEYSDTSVNVSRPAHLSCVPPPESLSSFWQVQSTTVMFNVTCPGGSVVDIILDVIEVDQTTATSDITIATGTLKVQYYLALDGPTANKLVPTSLNTTS